MVQKQNSFLADWYSFSTPHLLHSLPYITADPKNNFFQLINYVLLTKFSKF